MCKFSGRMPARPSVFRMYGLTSGVRRGFNSVHSESIVGTCVRRVGPSFVFRLTTRTVISASCRGPFSAVAAGIVNATSMLRTVHGVA